MKSVNDLLWAVEEENDLDKVVNEIYANCGGGGCCCCCPSVIFCGLK
jgi:hypothetical protein